MNCLRMYGHARVPHRDAEEQAVGGVEASRTRRVPRATRSACAPAGSPPPKTVIFAPAPAGPNAGSVPSQRSQCSISSSGFAARYAWTNASAICSEAESSPRGLELMCKSRLTSSSSDPLTPITVKVTSLRVQDVVARRR